MMNRRRQTEATQRAAERRQREDDAVRLAEVVPHLKSLRIEIEERRQGSRIPEASHIRHVVAHAPALFVLQCCDSQCRDGGHDITGSVLAALRGGATRFEGEDECCGHVGSASCGRVLRYVLIATYE